MALYLSSQIAPPEGKSGKNVGQCFCVEQLGKQCKVDLNECRCVVIRQILAQTELKCGIIWVPGIGIPTIEINGIASRVNFAPKHLEKVGCTNLKCV